MSKRRREEVEKHFGVSSVVRGSTCPKVFEVFVVRWSGKLKRADFAWTWIVIIDVEFEFTIYAQQNFIKNFSSYELIEERGRSVYCVIGSQLQLPITWQVCCSFQNFRKVFISCRRLDSMTQYSNEPSLRERIWNWIMPGEKLTWSNTFSGELSSWYDELDARLISIRGVNGAIKLVVTAPVVDSCDCWLIWIDDGLFLCGKTPAGLPFASISAAFASSSSIAQATQKFSSQFSSRFCLV